MTVTDKRDTAALKREQSAREPTSPPELRRGLNQPWRAVVAVAEVLVAAGAAVLAVVVWRGGVDSLDVGAPVPVTKFDGGQIALSVLLGGAAVVLVIDAIRQVMLAVNAVSKKPGVLDEPFVDDESELS